MVMQSLVRTGLIAAIGLVMGCGGGDGGTTAPTRGTINGTVSADGSGLADVVVALPGKGTQTTSGSGTFNFTEVAAGAHTLTLTLPEGFELEAGQTAESSVTVTAGQTATVNWTLRAAGPTETTTETVQMTSSSFSPAAVTVKAGSTVIWVNQQAILHTITPEGHSQWERVETSATGEVLRVTLDTPGEYEYHCEVHAGMSGEITVQP